MLIFCFIEITHHFNEESITLIIIRKIAINKKIIGIDKKASIIFSMPMSISKYKKIMIPAIGTNFSSL
jgi:hypothetical protein